MEKRSPKSKIHPIERLKTLNWQQQLRKQKNLKAVPVYRFRLRQCLGAEPDLIASFGSLGAGRDSEINSVGYCQRIPLSRSSFCTVSMTFSIQKQVKFAKEKPIKEWVGINTSTTAASESFPWCCSLFFNFRFVHMKTELNFNSFGMPSRRCNWHMTRMLTAPRGAGWMEGWCLNSELKCTNKNKRCGWRIPIDQIQNKASTKISVTTSS